MPIDEPRPVAKRRRLTDTIVSTLTTVALVGAAVGITAYRLYVLFLSPARSGIAKLKSLDGATWASQWKRMRSPSFLLSNSKWSNLRLTLNKHSWVWKSTWYLQPSPAYPSAGVPDTFPAPITATPSSTGAASPA